MLIAPLHLFLLCVVVTDIRERNTNSFDDQIRIIKIDVVCGSGIYQLC